MNVRLCRWFGVGRRGCGGGGSRGCRRRRLDRGAKAALKAGGVGRLAAARPRVPIELGSMLPAACVERPNGRGVVVFVLSAIGVGGLSDAPERCRPVKERRC